VDLHILYLLLHLFYLSLGIQEFFLFGFYGFFLVDDYLPMSLLLSHGIKIECFLLLFSFFLVFALSKGISFGVIVLREQVQLCKFMLFTNRLKMIPVLLELITVLDLNLKFSLELGFDYFNLYDPVREIVADGSFFQELGCL